MWPVIDIQFIILEEYRSRREQFFRAPSRICLSDGMNNIVAKHELSYIEIGISQMFYIANLLLRCFGAAFVYYHASMSLFCSNRKRTGLMIFDKKPILKYFFDMPNLFGCDFL